MSCINNYNCVMMSRAKSKGVVDLCGDCSCQDAPFASLNRGIFLCTDCASVHRSLGAHISIVKALRQGTWSSSVLNYINLINAHGANSVWEHTLLDPASKQQKRKPLPKDTIQTKSNFIRSKHVNLDFVLKTNFQNDDTTALEVELSKQLHASVRSANLETSLRLLAQGANCNYIHTEKSSTTPLHSAAKSGQSAQIELLILYGADVNATDANGSTAVDLARQNGFTQLAERLVEASYEVTDRIIYFLCGRKPDHSSGHHLIIPEQSKVEINEHLKIARGKLQLIPNKMFEELVMDLFEEVDRREMETIWSTITSNPEIGAVPFLPTNPHLSATRNQGRQKLARFTHVEFCGLLNDILVDARRRQNIANLRPLEQVQNFVQLRSKRDSNSDEEPLYDHVAEDEPIMLAQNSISPTPPPPIPVTSSPSAQNNTKTSPVDEEVVHLRKQLRDSEMALSEMRNMVEKLSMENSFLKTRIDSQAISSTELHLQIHDSPSDSSSNNATNAEPLVTSSTSSANMSAKRPVSMFEIASHQTPRNEDQQLRPPVTQSLYSVASNSSTSSSNSAQLPLVEEVTKRTEVVTRRIQELWLAMQDLSKKDTFVPCSERIRIGVTDLIAIFPPTLGAGYEVLKSALQQLTVNTASIQTECANLHRALSVETPINIEVHLQAVRNCAYNLAKATKTLVTQFQ